MKKRILSLLVVFCMVLSLVAYMPITTVNASNTANELVSVAKGELGNGYSKYTHYVGSIGGRYDYAWCAAFVSWCGNQAGVSCIGKTASCYSQYQYMTSHGGYEVATPQAGDVVFFYCNKCNDPVYRWCHVGIMVDANTSIDGNYNSRVSYDTSYSHTGNLGYKHSVTKKYVRPNYGQTSITILPGTVDTSWNVPTSVTASRRISTYDQYGNVESNHYIDPGDNCYISEVYTNGFVKIQYPVSGGTRWAYVKAADFALKKKEVAVAKLPGTVDSSWNVPTNVTASRRISTYDQYGNVESNHYVDPGDNCYIPEVYTNGFVKIQYPVSGGKRWAYAKASDFSLKKKEQGNTLPATNIHAWFSAEKMGGEVSNVRLGEYLYLCYRIETKDGNILDSSIGNYSVKETIYYPNGDTHPYNYGKSNNNWIGSQLNQWGTYRGVVEISGDYTGTAEVAYTLTKPKDMVLETWFSKTPMGDAVSYLEKGQSYYMCYGIKCDGKYYFNKYANVDYSVTEAVYGPDSKKVYEYTYDKSDNNWIRFTATQTGTYKGTTTIKGCFNSSDTATCVCKDKSKPKLHNIVIKTYPKKVVYTVGEPIDTSGMVVTAYYMDLSYKNITNYKVIGNTAQAGHKYVTVSYTEDGITDTVQFEITVNEKPKEMVTITYDPKGGTLSNRTQTGVKNTYDAIMTDKPTKSIQLRFNANGGSPTPNSVTLWQNFKDWDYFNGSVHVHYRGGDKFLMRGDCTFSACYEPAKIRSLPVIQREGYTFDGWYTSNNQKAYIGMPLDRDTTLEAHWIQKPDVIDLDEENDDQEQSKQDDEIEDLDPDDLFDYGDSDEDGENDDEEVLEVGDEITTDDVIYTITELDDGPCVEYTELFDDDIKNVVIPDTVAIDGVVYKVTSVAPKAFYKNTSVKKVTIAGYTTKIGAKAFYGCKSLKEIVILSTKIQSGSIGSKAFSNMAKNAKIYVPRAKYKTYKKLLKKAGVGSKAKIYWFTYK